jgi:MFS transporter, UMF1 family
MFGRIPRRGDPRQGLFLSIVLYNAVTTPAIGFLLPSFGIASGPLAVAVVLSNQVVAFAFSWLLGRRLLAGVATRLGTKEAILLALSVYAVVSIWGYFMHTAAEFWLLAWMVGLVQGGSQALSRSLFGNMVPKAQTAEFFGFYDMSSKFAGLAGPLLFAVVGQMFGSSRLSIVSLVIFFIAGSLILARVDEQEGIRLARQADAETMVGEVLPSTSPV